MSSGPFEAAGAGRLARLRRWMADEEVDAAYVTRPVSIAYLTHFHAETQERLMALAVRLRGATLVVPAIERDRAARAASDFGVVSWLDGEDPYEMVREALAGANRVAVEKEHLTLSAAEKLQATVHVLELTDVSGAIRAFRSTKNAVELERLRRAAEMTDSIYEEVISRVHVGQSELEVAAAIAAATGAAGGTMAFDPSVQFGVNSAIPHHRPSARALREGELVLLDFGATVDGYHADITRVAVAGSPTERQREIHSLVLAAHDAAIEAMRAGVTAGDVDAAAREVFRAAGEEDHFIHRTGHGLGLEIHEDPSLDPGSEAVLEAGMVATIEPGHYTDGWGGVRIEDDLVVERNGCRLLTRADRSLRVIG